VRGPIATPGLVEERHDRQDTQIHDRGGKRNAGLSLPFHGIIRFCLPRQHHRRRRRRIKAAEGRHPQSARGRGPVALRQIARVGQGANDDECEPHLPRRDRRQVGHRLVRQKRQDDAGQDQELTGGDDLLQFDAARQRVQLFAAGEQQYRGHGKRHRDPRRQRKRDGAENIGVGVEHRHYETDIPLVLFVTIAEVLVIRDGKPDPEHDEAGGERNEMCRIEKVEDAAGGSQQRKGADAARTLDFAVGEKIFESQAEKQAQTEQERRAGQ